MTISRSPELERAKAILDEASLAPGARERIYWGVVHKPVRVARGRWRISLMVFGWLTAASAAYGLGRIVYWALPLQVNQPKTLASTTLQALPPEQHRAAARGHSAQARSVASSDNVEALTAPPTPQHAEVEPLPPTARMADVTPSPPTTRMADVAPSASPARAVDVVAPRVKELSESTITRDPGKPSTSALSLQVADYREAVALLSQNPHAALERLYTHRRRYPNSAIAHEVDLRIIQSLLAIGQPESARAAARSFLQRYPNSARAEEVSRIAEPND